jgi:hypothetical protein
LPSFKAVGLNFWTLGWLFEKHLVSSGVIAANPDGRGQLITSNIPMASEDSTHDGRVTRGAREVEE